MRADERTFREPYNQLYRPQGRFRKERLPSPEGYYAQYFDRLAGHGTWRNALCPFHDDHNPSFSINLETGGYKCFACGAKGGDVLAFHRAITGMGFKDAAKALGAWEE